MVSIEHGLEPMRILVTLTPDDIGWPVRLVKLKAIVIFSSLTTCIGLEDVGLVIVRVFCDAVVVGDAVMPNSCNKNLMNDDILDKD